MQRSCLTKNKMCIRDRYKAVAPVTETLLAAVANKLTAAFNLKKVELQQTNLLETSVVAESVKTENKLETENKSVQVEPEREEIPLPPEEPEAVEIGEACLLYTSCVVNGPGEAREADIGIAGGIGEGLLFRKGEIIKKVSEDKIVDELFDEIKKILVERKMK